MNRRELLALVAGVAFVDTLFRQDLLAESVKPIAADRLKQLHEDWQTAKFKHPEQVSKWPIGIP